MNLSKILILVTTLVLSPVAMSDEESRKEAEILLNSMGMSEALDQSVKQMIEIQVQANPKLVPLEGVMIEFFQKHMSFESLKADLLTIYSDAFTASELRDLNAFYATPTGKKTIELMPQLMAQGAQLGVTRVQENMPELEAMVKAEQERLK